MVAPRKTRRVVCTLVHVPANDPIDTHTDNRPSNRLPWSDPTIARLVEKLQDEVRHERRHAKLTRRVAHAPVADLDPPSPAADCNGDWRDEPRWTWPNN